MKPKTRVNIVDNTTSEAATICNSAIAGEQVNQIEMMFQRHSIYDANYDSDYGEFGDNCVAVISDSDNIREVEPVNMQIRISNTETKALVDSGSVCTVINRNLAKAVVLNRQESFWVQSQENHYLTIFSNEIIKAIGVVNTSVKCSDWAAVNVNTKVVEDGHRSIVARDLFPQLGLSLTQTKQVSNVDQNQCLIKKQIAFDFPG